MPIIPCYGTLNKQFVAHNGLVTTLPASQPKMKRKEERQPLLTSSQMEPVNDTYDRTPVTSTVDITLDTADRENCSFDPVAERELEHPTSNLDTMIHLLKGNIGTGILAMPDAFRNAGLIIGLMGTLFMGAICTHCMHMLVRCSHTLCRRLRMSSLSFADVTEHAFRTGPPSLRPLANYARSAVNVFLCFTQLGFCCVYFVFVSANLRDFFSNYNVHFSISTYLGFILIPMILQSLVKNLKLLTPISLVAALLTLGGLGVTFFYLLQGLPKMSSVKAFSSWSQLPLYFGTAIYAFEGIGMVLPLENNMKTPQDFTGWTGVLNTGMVIVTSLYTAVGFFGYLRYGEAVRSGSITLNLPSNDLLAQSVKLTMALAIFLSYGLQLYVPVNIVWPALERRFGSGTEGWMAKWGELGLRVTMVMSTFTLAAIIPNLAAVISLVGAVSSSTLAIIFPPIIELVTFWESRDFGKMNWILWKDLFLIVFGLLGFGFGSYASIANIIRPPTEFV